MAKKKFINQLYRKNKSSRVTSKMLQEQSVNAILTDPENRTLWINGNPYGNAYIDRADNNYDNLSTSNNYEEIGTIHGEIFNDFDNNEAKGDYSHAEGLNTRTKNLGEHAEGKYNYSVEGSTISTIGIGTSDDKRKNAMRVDNDGSVYLSEIKQQLPDGRRITHDPCNYDGTEKKEDTRSLQEILAGLGNMIKVTYGELRTLIDNKKLIPGMQYRITDYGSTGNSYISEYDTSYQFAGNQFDIIVVADDIDTLNVEGRACEHDFDNDIKILAENIINNEKDTINNVLSEEQKNDPTFFVSYENFKIYSETQNAVIKDSYYAPTKTLYNKILNQTSEIDKKKKYFTDYHTDFSKWKLKYDINNNIYNWVNNDYEDKHILVNVSINDGNNVIKYEIREYCFDSNIDYTPGDSDITYKYKWRLNRYQKVNSKSVTNFLENDENEIITVKKPSFDEIIPEAYNNVLLTELKYPTSDYTGSLLFCKDSSLYNLYIDNETSKKDYLMEDILLVNIYNYNNTESEDTYFLYSGTIFYDNKLVHKWVESTSNTYEKFITGTPNIVNNNYLAENWNTQIRNDSNGNYYRYILSETLTPFSIDDEDENKQKYITNDSTQTPSFIKDSYFKEYIVTPKTINKNGMYIVGICDQSNEKLAFDGMTIFKKEDKNSNEYKIHYNLTEEIYSYTQNNTTKYYNVWYINNILNTNDIVPNRILTGGYDSDKRALEYIEKLKSTEINDLDKLQSLKDELYNNITWYETLLSGGNTNVFSEKFYEYSTTYEIKTTVFNTIKFNFNKELKNIKQIINNDDYNSNSLTKNIPVNKSDYKLFNFYYDTYKTNNYQGINLNIYKNNNNNDENFIIGVDGNNNVFIYYDYIQDDKIIQNSITKEYYNYFNFVDNKYFAQGVIIYLCDEFNNECEYDFKNIKFYKEIEYGKYGLYYFDYGKNDVIYDDNLILTTPDELKYFYTFSRISEDYVYDDSINENYIRIENNILKNVNNIYNLNVNIFINCVLKDNNFYSVSSLTLANSELYNNNFIDIFSFNNNFYLEEKGTVRAFYPLYCINNKFIDCYWLNFKYVSGGQSGTFEISNNDLYKYNYKTIYSDLKSSILYNNDTQENIGDVNNRNIDIPNIKTKKYGGKKLLCVDYDNINIKETDDQNKNNIDLNSYYIKCNNKLKFLDLYETNIDNSVNLTGAPIGEWVESYVRTKTNTEFSDKNYKGNWSENKLSLTKEYLGFTKDANGNFNFQHDKNIINNNDQINTNSITESYNQSTTNYFESSHCQNKNAFTIKSLTILDFDISENSTLYNEIKSKADSNNSTLKELFFDNTVNNDDNNNVFNVLCDLFGLSKNQNGNFYLKTDFDETNLDHDFINLFPGLFLNLFLKFEKTNYGSDLKNLLRFYFNINYELNTEIYVYDENEEENKLTEYKLTLHDCNSSSMKNKFLENNFLYTGINKNSLKYKYFYSYFVYSPFLNSKVIQKNINAIRNYFKDILNNLKSSNKIVKIKTNLNIKINNTGIKLEVNNYQYQLIKYLKISSLFFIPQKFLNTINGSVFYNSYKGYNGTTAYNFYLSYDNYLIYYDYGNYSELYGSYPAIEFEVDDNTHKVSIAYYDGLNGQSNISLRYFSFLSLDKILKPDIYQIILESARWNESNFHNNDPLFMHLGSDELISALISSDEYKNLLIDIKFPYKYKCIFNNEVSNFISDSNIYIGDGSITIIKSNTKLSKVFNQYINLGFDNNTTPVIRFNDIVEVDENEETILKEYKYKINLKSLNYETDTEFDQ